MGILRFTALGVVLGIVTTAAQANLLVNGGFEQPGSGCVAGATSLPGWTVTTGNIDIINAACSDMSPAQGTYFLDLTGSFGAGAGTIAQTVATRIGSRYTLSFYFGGNPQWQQQSGNPFSIYQNDGPIKSMDLLVNGKQLGETYTIDTTGHPYTDAGWMFESTTFTATTAVTQVDFQSLDGSNGNVYGPLLDGVDLHPVPEPSTLILMGVGLAGLAFANRRFRGSRRHAAPPDPRVGS